MGFINLTIIRCKKIANLIVCNWKNIRCSFGIFRTQEMLEINQKENERPREGKGNIRLYIAGEDKNEQRGDKERETEREGERKGDEQEGGNRTKRTRHGLRDLQVV